MSEKLYTTGEIAEHLKVEDATVRSWLRTGKIAGIKLPNGFYRITESTLTALLGKDQSA